SHARVCLSPIRIQRSTARSSPEKAPTSLGPSGLSTDPVTGIAVLEYGLTEILPPVGALSKHAERLCRPGRQASRAHPRKAGALDLRKWRRPRDRLSAGGRWIRTSSSAPNRQRLASSEMRPIDR